MGDTGAVVGRNRHSGGECSVETFYAGKKPTSNSIINHSA